MNIEKSSDLQSVMFEVEKVRSEEITPGYNFPSSSEYAIINRETNMVLNYCSEAYTLQDNRDLVLDTYNELSKVFDVQVKTRTERHARFFVDFTLKNSIIPVIGSDTINPMITLQNSYDGSLPALLKFSMRRMVCGNGLFSLEENMVGGKRHVGKLGFSVKDVISQIQDNQKNIGELKVLTDYKLNPAQSIELIESVKDFTDFPKKMAQPENLLNLMNEEIAKTGGRGQSKWYLYNALNFQLNHTENSLPLPKAKKIDSQVMEYISDYQFN